MNILAFIILFGIGVALGVLFYFLHRRVEALSHSMNRINRDMDTLYVNQQTLDTDCKKIFMELQNAQKEISRINHR